MSVSLSGLAEHLAWVDPWLLPLDATWALPISRLEAVASLMALAMVGFNLRVNPLGWPLAIASSALYALLFARSRLYGEAALQLVFIALSACGWRSAPCWTPGPTRTCPMVTPCPPQAAWSGNGCWPASGSTTGLAGWR